eukprot:GHVT01045881.1.p1 GENE.GHVT01045881.1~~GHVT01045881.1.p1  ORF type:complete len:816 (-),score=111.79 GHVT01045881.1:1020-3467(-)
MMNVAGGRPHVPTSHRQPKIPAAYEMSVSASRLTSSTLPVPAQASSCPDKCDKENSAKERSHTYIIDKNGIERHDSSSGTTVGSFGASNSNARPVLCHSESPRSPSSSSSVPSKERPHRLSTSKSQSRGTQSMSSSGSDLDCSSPVESRDNCRKRRQVPTRPRQHWGRRGGQHPQVLSPPEGGKPGRSRSASSSPCDTAHSRFSSASGSRDGDRNAGQSDAKAAVAAYPAGPSLFRRFLVPACPPPQVSLGKRGRLFTYPNEEFPGYRRRTKDDATRRRGSSSVDSRCESTSPENVRSRSRDRGMGWRHKLHHLPGSARANAGKREDSSQLRQKFLQGRRALRSNRRVAVWQPSRKAAPVLTQNAAKIQVHIKTKQVSEIPEESQPSLTDGGALHISPPDGENERGNASPSRLGSDNGRRSEGSIRGRRGGDGEPRPTNPVEQLGNASVPKTAASVAYTSSNVHMLPSIPTTLCGLGAGGGDDVGGAGQATVMPIGLRGVGEQPRLSAAPVDAAAQPPSPPPLSDMDNTCAEPSPHIDGIVATLHSIDIKEEELQVLRRRLEGLLAAHRKFHQEQSDVVSSMHPGEERQEDAVPPDHIDKAPFATPAKAHTVVDGLSLPPNQPDTTPNAALSQVSVRPQEVKAGTFMQDAEIGSSGLMSLRGKLAASPPWRVPGWMKFIGQPAATSPTTQPEKKQEDAQVSPGPLILEADGTDPLAPVSRVASSQKVNLRAISCSYSSSYPPRSHSNSFSKSLSYRSTSRDSSRSSGSYRPVTKRHETGSCVPCRFYLKPNGCAREHYCDFCHHKDHLVGGRLAP